MHDTTLEGDMTGSCGGGCLEQQKESNWPSFFQKAGLSF